MNSQRGTFVLLRAGALRLLLAQAEVGPAEYLETRPEPSEVPGLLRCDDARAYAALSDAMTLLDECPRERFIACTLAGDERLWCWDELRVLIDIELEPVALPAGVADPSTPVAAYVELDGAPAFLCSAADVRAFASRTQEGGRAT
jgi:hypothetical protein